MFSRVALLESNPNEFSNASAFAAISDPFGLDNDPGSTSPATEFFFDGQALGDIAPIPLPAMLWPFIGTALGLSFAARRQNRNKLCS